MTTNATMIWVLAGWRKRQGDKPLSIKGLAKLAKIGHPAIYRIRKGKGVPDQETLDKLALYFDEPAPVVTQGVTIDPGSLPEPSTALGWLGLARESIERAEGLLRRQATSGAAAVEQSKKLVKLSQSVPRKGRGNAGRTPPPKPDRPAAGTG